ncbi:MULTISPECIES: thermonuclease family protein [unclassified Streptomyces]|uniref:thermonuclease family protein n=1 Tax=unclassified Streptomyces TaxID=2593676 RepID=UPI002035DF9F|nr:MULTISPECIES: thermonuclease family protein [unclassified Streptomyces]
MGISAALILIIIAAAIGSSGGGGGDAKPPPVSGAPEETSPPNEPAPQGGVTDTEEADTEPPVEIPPTTDSPTVSGNTEEAETKPPVEIPPATDSPTVSGNVVDRIIDGDTIEVRGDGGILPKGQTSTVRLLEIDAPEVGTCYSDEATARIAELLPVGSSVRIERDKDLKDPYDRYLLYVWNDQEEFVNHSLVSTGHAEAVLYQPNDKYWPSISQAGNDAQDIGAGLWTACAEETQAPAPPAIPEPTPPQDSYLPPPPPDLDCSDLDGPVPVGPDDPHRLDRDGDGIGCESN